MLQLHSVDPKRFGWGTPDTFGERVVLKSRGRMFPAATRGEPVVEPAVDHRAALEALAPFAFRELGCACVEVRGRARGAHR